MGFFLAFKMNLGVDLKKRLGVFSLVINCGALVFLNKLSGKLGFRCVFTLFTPLFTLLFNLFTPFMLFTLLFTLFMLFTLLFTLFMLFTLFTLFTFVFTCVLTTLFLPTCMGSRIPMVVNRLPIRSFN